MTSASSTKPAEGENKGPSLEKAFDLMVETLEAPACSGEPPAPGGFAPMRATTSATIFSISWFWSISLRSLPSPLP